MPWRPLPRIAFAICTYPFPPSSPADLPLQIGDELYIIEQGGKNGSWYRGYLVAPPSLLAGLTSGKGHALEARVFSGIFPKVCVEIRELLGEVNKYGRDDQYIGEAGLQVNGTARLSGSWPVPPRKNSETTSGLEERKEKTTQANTTIPLGQKPPAPVPMLKIGDETLTSREEPLVDEIGSCLKEWHSTNLHGLLLNREYPLLHEMSKLVDRLDSSRKQLLHKTLTKSELAELRESTIWNLVNANKALNGEVIVRGAEQKGRILTADDSVINISTLQAKMSLFDEWPDTSTAPRSLHHLLINVKKLASLGDKPTTYAIAIFLKTKGAPVTMLSENFTIEGSVTPARKSNSFDERVRTLFVNLNNANRSGGYDEESRIFLVVKALTTEPFRLTSQAPSKSSNSDSGHNPSFTSLNATIKSANFLTGRKSAKSQIKEADANLARPATGSSYQKNTKHDAGKTDSSSNWTKGTARRITALGLLDITQMIKKESQATHSVTLWSSMSHAGVPSERDETWNDVIKELMPIAIGEYTVSPWNAPFEVQLQSFRHEDSGALIHQMPTLLHSVQTTPRIGFARAPTNARSDIYITLCEPVLPASAFLSHPRLGSVALSSEVGMANLQLTLEVRDSAGDRISHCIHPSSNSTGHTAWRTTAVEARESWNQTIRLAIDPQEVPGSHIVMSIADGANFPFALCWMPLWSEDAFIRDGEHILILYRYDEHTSNMYNGKGAYLKLPWSSRTKDETVTGPMASVRLQTFLCSTKYSQDPTLLGLLKWREIEEHGLVPLLKQFAFVPEIEIVKLVPDVLDSLFEVLVEHAGNDEIEDVVFSALVFVSGIIQDRRFHVEPLVDNYLKTRFNFPFAFPCLVRSFVHLLSDPISPDISRQLRATCKVAGHILRFMVNARKQQIAKEVGIGIQSHSPTFAKDLQSIFDALENLMRMKSSVLVGTKTLVVQNFPNWLPELSEVMTPHEIAGIAAGFVNSCSRVENRLILYKLVLILNLSSSRILTTSAVQQSWHRKTLKWLAPYWGMTSVPSPQWRAQIRLCCSIVATQMETFSLQGAEWISKVVESYAVVKTIPKPSTDVFSSLFARTVTFPTKPIQTDAVFDEALIELAALLSLANTGLLDYSISSQSGLSNLLSNALLLCKSVLNCEAFPSDWLSLYVFHHKSILQFLETLSEILLRDYLPPPDDANEFPTKIWGDFFEVLLKLCSSNALALEAFPEQKRRAVWKIAGDVRELGADLLQRTWQAIGWELSPNDQATFNLEKMGGYQVQYVPRLVGPIVELCLSVHEGLRGVAIGILRTMIASEWALSQNLSVIQAEIITSLDDLFKTKTLKDNVLNKIFVADLLEPFESSSTVKNEQLLVAAQALIDVIDKLLDLLIAVHTTSSSTEAIQIMDTLNLMIFLRDMQKTDIYIDYTHKLAKVQADAHNHTEAGLALKMHADLFSWNFSSSLPASKNPPFPAQTEFERKEQIYFEMIKHFEEGSAWQLALNAYRDLAREYEYNAFDFSKLARTHRAIASIQEKISRGERGNPKFFRVIYRGLGFPQSLRGRQFILQGVASDRLPTFTDRMLGRYPSAQITGNEDVNELEGQYLSIYPVGPQRNFFHPINRRARVAQSVREHYMLGNPKEFTTISRRQVSHAGSKQQTVDKTIYTTAEAFPTILRQSEIIKTETVMVTPVQIGLDRTNRKTQELLAVEREVQNNPDASLNEMTDMLTAFVNPESSGCVAEYWDLAIHPPPSDKHGLGDLEDEKLLYEALKIALIDHVITIRRCLSLYTRPTDQPTKIQLTSAFETNFSQVLARAQIMTPQSPNKAQPNHKELSSLPEPVSTLIPKLPSPRIPSSTNKESSRHLEPENNSSTAQKSDHLLSFRSFGSGLKSPPSAWLSSSHSSVSDLSSPVMGKAAVAPSPVAGYTNGSSTREVSNTALEEPRLTKQTSSQSLKGLQARVGNATKRLSVINLGKRGLKSAIKSPGVKSVEE